MSMLTGYIEADSILGNSFGVLSFNADVALKHNTASYWWLMVLTETAVLLTFSCRGVEQGYL